ncbi:MAG: HigA family addiction module antidote protein [Bacteroidetes bacterium]|nr:HigA family addiction module antidote protein [Bacteroidota bacterium]
MMTNTTTYYSDLSIPPGEFLEEVIEDMGMGKDELARRMNRPPTKLTAIFNGSKAITPDTALQLEKVTGVPAHIWIGLEAEYRLTLARNNEAKEHEKLKEETKLVKNYCYNQLQKMGFVKGTTKPLEKVLELHKYFGVTSLRNLTEVKRYAPLYRQQKSGKGKISSEALTSWLRLGELKAYDIDCAEFDKDKLISIIPELRGMTLKSPKEFRPLLEQKLASVGIALVIVPHFPNTGAHGATFWVNKNKAVLMLTLRGSWADMFWFSLFHEIGHILLHSRQQVIIESDSSDFTVQQLEDEANGFASRNLIPPQEYKDFLKGGSFFKNDIKPFARKIAIHPGVVVGRLHHEKIIDISWCNDLRQRYVWE